MSIVFGARSASAPLVGPGMKAPSSAISRGEIPSRLRSATVSGRSAFSCGLPGEVEAGRISPRSPGLCSRSLREGCATQ